MSKSKTVESTKPNINDPSWSDYVIGLLSEDEKIKGNPTTDGLRRIFEVALDCVIISSSSDVVQSPDPNNEKRATVVHSLTYVLNDKDIDQDIKTRHVNGAADVYWGNCDKIYRNHPVAVAETRAEGRALRRGLRLRKVVAAEELAENIEDDVMGDNVSKITNNQINFMDVLSQRLNINMIEMIKILGYNKNIKELMHDDAVSIIRELSKYQQTVDNIPESILGYNENWKP
jgi:hypothetical protein